ncbi:MAG: tetratricopeptide repeat protein [Pseudomonadota bacterium]
MKWKFSPLFTALIVGLFPFHAAAQVTGVGVGPGIQSTPDQRTQERLDRLENALQDMQAVLYSVEGREVRAQNVPVTGSGYSNRPAVPVASVSLPEGDLAVRLVALETALAQLTGQVEEMSFRLRQQEQAIERLETQTAPAAAPPATFPELGRSPMGMPGAPTDLIGGNDDQAEAPVVTMTLPDDPSAAYNLGYDAVLAADYTLAEASLSAFVQKFPNAPQTPEAKFLLGEVYLATGANEAAARVFLDHVSAHKEDARSAEAYLKLGTAFARLERNAEACNVFRVGQSKFPNMEGALKQQFSAERNSAGC